MASGPKKPKYTLEIEAPANGRIRKATIVVKDAEGKIRATDQGNLAMASERRRVGKELARQLGDDDIAKWQEAVENKWREILDKQQRYQEQLAAGSPEAVPAAMCVLLESNPHIMRRPLSLIEGRAYAAAWGTCRQIIAQGVHKDGTPIVHDPPLVTDTTSLLIIRDDGQLFTEAPLANTKRLRELGFEVRLREPLPPDREWSGAGVTRYCAGERPNPAEVLGRVVAVIDRFLDFARSLAPQQTMCEMIACYTLSTYFLEGLNVIGYLWSNGEKGAGKTVCLQVVTELAYLGQLLLAGSSYPCLRDMADYGATLAFDDAEAVMDIRRSDPDKRTLLLAGSRRGATIAVKELVGDKWETRHVNTFCPRLFSAIRLPDDVLGSRSILVPQVRSGDARRAKANPMDPLDWPTDRRRLIDDLWAMGLTHLSEIPKYDRMGAEFANLCGRNLDPWRPILAVAAWLDARHGVERLYERMERLSRDYQRERSDIEDDDKVRVLFRALVQLSEGWEAEETRTLHPKAIAEVMNDIAKAEELAEPDKPFTTARKVGWLLKRQRFKRPDGRSEQGKLWQTTRAEIAMAARGYGLECVSENGS